MQTIFIVALFSTLQGDNDYFQHPGVYAHGWVANVVVDHHPPDEEDQQRRDQEVCDARPDHPNFIINWEEALAVAFPRPVPLDG